MDYEEIDSAAMTSAAATPVLSLAKEKILELVKEREKEEKAVLSLVVVGSSFALPSLPPTFLMRLPSASSRSRNDSRYRKLTELQTRRTRRCRKVDADGPSPARARSTF